MAKRALWDKILCPREKGRAKERVIQSKRERGGFLATIDESLKLGGALPPFCGIYMVSARHRESCAARACATGGSSWESRRLVSQKSSSQVTIGMPRDRMYRATVSLSEW